MAFVAIGATLVGSIAWTSQIGQKISKGDELGYFAFGGSTCIVVFPDDSISWDVDILQNSRKSLESLVKVGERLGVKAGSKMESSADEKAAMLLRSQSAVEEHGVVPLEERREMKMMMTQAHEVLTSVVDVEQAENMFDMKGLTIKEEEED